MDYGWELAEFADEEAVGGRAGIGWKGLDLVAVFAPSGSGRLPPN